MVNFLNKDLRNNAIRRMKDAQMRFEDNQNSLVLLSEQLFEHRKYMKLAIDSAIKYVNQVIDVPLEPAKIVENVKCVDDRYRNTLDELAKEINKVTDNREIDKGTTLDVSLGNKTLNAKTLSALATTLGIPGIEYINANGEKVTLPLTTSLMVTGVAGAGGNFGLTIGNQLIKKFAVNAVSTTIAGASAANLVSIAGWLGSGTLASIGASGLIMAGSSAGATIIAAPIVATNTLALSSLAIGSGAATVAMGGTVATSTIGTGMILGPLGIVFAIGTGIFTSKRNQKIARRANTATSQINLARKVIEGNKIEIRTLSKLTQVAKSQLAQDVTRIKQYGTNFDEMNLEQQDDFGDLVIHLQAAQALIEKIVGANENYNVNK
ncbi:hypothetical protein EQG49_04125 [Periweissella cryptocerci]|uniref:Uncharacterized protein n=1 Tax=Periweissella cryptocerci TaxID=2506420 RepID=A0A4P6YSL7_9LACO|nr:hypothetical protein [Periweissella cryptocerci]QBO35704.1 hypothetical protein EQG49_04125 [Periweissella cryptocerci]